MSLTWVTIFDAGNSVNESLNYMLDTFQTEIYLFFPTGLATKVEKATLTSFSVLVSMSSTVTLMLIYREKENKNFQLIQTTDDSGIQNSFIHFTSVLFFE